MKDIASMTKPELLKFVAAQAAEQEALEAENERLKTRPNRVYFTNSLWAKKDRKTARDPAWQGELRMIVPPEKYPGDVLWLSISQWKYGPDSPVQYKKNPPVFNLSLCASDPERATFKEAEYQEAHNARQARRS